MKARAKIISDRLLTRHGGPAVLVRFGGDPSDPPQNLFQDPNAPQPVPEPAETLHPITFMETGFELDHLNGSSIQARDVIGVATGDTAPVLGDLLRWRGRDHALMSIKPVQPDGGGPVVHWWLHARA